MIALLAVGGACSIAIIVGGIIGLIHDEEAA